MMEGMQWIVKLTATGVQCGSPERQQDSSADRRRSEERGFSDEGDCCGYNDFLASYLCFCRSPNPLYVHIWLIEPVEQTLFGMNFFSFEPGEVIVSRHFWIYWALSVPMTVATLALWFWWSRWAKRLGLSSSRSNALRGV